MCVNTNRYMYCIYIYIYICVYIRVHTRQPLGPYIFKKSQPKVTSRYKILLGKICQVAAFDDLCKVQNTSSNNVARYFRLYSRCFLGSYWIDTQLSERGGSLGRMYPKFPSPKNQFSRLVVWPATRKIWVKIRNVIFPNPWIFPFGPSFVCVFCYTQVEGDGVNHQPVNHHLTMDSRLLQHKQANLAASCRNPAKPPSSSSSSWLAKSSPSISFSFLVFLLLLKAMSQI